MKNTVDPVKHYLIVGCPCPGELAGSPQIEAAASSDNVVTLLCCGARRAPCFLTDLHEH